MGILDARNISDVVAEASRNGSRHTHSVQSLFNAAKSPPSDGDVWAFDATSKLWTPTALTVDGLSDVTVTSAAVGHTLYWNGSGWINVMPNLIRVNNSTARLLMTGSPYNLASGGIVYQIDTKEYWGWDGTNWVQLGGLGAWTSYTPTWKQNTTAVTNTISYSTYTQIGKTVHFQGHLVATGAGSAGGILNVSLPVAMITGGAGLVRPIGDGIVRDSSPNGYYAALATAATTTTMQFLPAQVSGTNYEGATDFTAAIASGDEISWDVTYEAA